MRNFTQRDVELLIDASRREEIRASFLQPHGRVDGEQRALRLAELARELAERLSTPESHTLDLPEGGASVTLTWRGITIKIETTNDGIMYLSRDGEWPKHSQWPQWLRAYEVDRG